MERWYTNKRIIWIVVILLLAILLVLSRGMHFGIEFTGGTRIPISLEKAVSTSIMEDLVENIKIRTARFGLTQVVVRSVGDRQIYVEISESDPEFVTEIEKILKAEGKFEAFVDGKQALKGEDIVLQSIKESPETLGQEIQWGVSFVIKQSGVDRFGSAAYGKGGHPVCLYIDRIEDAVVLVRSEIYNENYTMEEMETAIQDAAALSNDVVILIDDFNETTKNAILATNKTKAIIGQNETEIINWLNEKNFTIIERSIGKDICGDGRCGVTEDYQSCPTDCAECPAERPVKCPDGSCQKSEEECGKISLSWIPIGLIGIIAVGAFFKKRRNEAIILAVIFLICLYLIAFQAPPAEVETPLKNEMQPIFIRNDVIGVIVREWPAIGLLSAPRLSEDLATGIVGQSYEIRGGAVGETYEEKRKFAEFEMKTMRSVLSGGMLPVRIILGSATTIPASLGKEFLNYSIMGMIIAYVIVILIVIARYRYVKLIPLLIFIPTCQMITLVCVLGGIGTLDLATIAGLFASMGTSVDAQIVVADEFAGKGIASRDDAKRRIRKSFYIITRDAAIVIIAIFPLLFSNLVEIIGFVTAMLIGTLLTIYITTQVYTAFAETEFRQ